MYKEKNYSNWYEKRFEELKKNIEEVSMSKSLNIVTNIKYLHDDMKYSDNFNHYYYPDIFDKNFNVSIDVIILKKIPNLGVDKFIQLKLENFAKLYVFWLWDNHHMEIINYELSTLSDITFCAHSYCMDYLVNFYSILGGHVAPSIWQWSAKDSASHFEKYGDIPRHNALYGGYREYSDQSNRHQIVQACIDAISDNALYLRSEMLDVAEDKYFSLDREERFREWCSHKVSLNLPLDKDFGCRIFDALLCGQIPLVANNIFDLDTLIPPPLQQELPVIRFEEPTVECISDAYSKALSRFDQDGNEGVRRRHRYVLENHMSIHRIREILANINVAGWKSQDTIQGERP